MAQSTEQQTRRFPKPGEIFAERYRIQELLGVGGFARVYRGNQFEIDRAVAVKIFSIPVARDDSEERTTSEKRFYREARLLSRLKSATTVQMYDYGRTDDGWLYMIFELVEGTTLSNLIKQYGALDATRAETILVQVLRSLREAHQQGILHRDIKPGNIMVYDRLGLRDQVKVLDFGIAKSLASQAAGESNVTVEGGVVGTPRYMSPEQATGRPLTAGSDLFSAGLLAYEMLVGKPAIESGEIFAAQRQLLTEDLRIPDEVRIPAHLRSVVAKLLARDPQQRYERARDALRDLGVEVTQDAFPHSLAGGANQNPVPLFVDSARGALSPVDTPQPLIGTAPEADTLVTPPPSQVLQAAQQENDSAEVEPRDRRRGLLPFFGLGVAVLVGLTVVMVLIGDDGNTEPAVEEVAKDAPAIAIQPEKEQVAEQAPKAGPAVRSASIYVRAATGAARGALSAVAESRAKPAVEAPKKKPPVIRRPPRKRPRKPASDKPSYDFQAVDEL